MLFRSGARRGVSTAVVAGVAIVLIAIAGISGYYIGTSTSPASSTTSVSSSSASTSSATQDQSALAQAECAKAGATCLTLYSTMDSSSFTNTIGPLFYQEYPWAQGKVAFVALSAAQLSTRTISEFKANAVQADVVEGTIGPFYPNVVAGAIQNFTSPEIAQLGYNTTDFDKNGAWSVLFWSPSDIVYNPTVLSAKGLPVPKTWSDLGNPVYKGYIDFQTGTNLATTGSVFYWLYTQMGNASWTQLMQAIAANKPAIATSGGAVTTNAVTGQYPIGIGSYNDYLTAKATPNATVGAVTPSPTLMNPAVVGIAKNDPHPQMARLFENWWLSPSGQAAIAATGRTPHNSVLARGLGLLPSGVPAVNAWGNNIPVVFANSTYWSGVFRSFFGG